MMDLALVVALSALNLDMEAAAKKNMIDKIHKGNDCIEKREKTEKKKLNEQFGIASGLLKTRNLLMAPVANINGNEQDLLIPPPKSDHPDQRRIVRRLAGAQLHMPPEMVVQAETRFAESPFVQECLEWTNVFRR